MISEESRPVLRLVHSRCEQLEFDFDTPKAMQRMLKRPVGHTELDRERLLVAPRAPANARAPLARVVGALSTHLVGSPEACLYTRTPFVLDRDPYIVRVPHAAVASVNLGTFSGVVDGPPIIAIEAMAARERRLDQGRRIEQYLAAGTLVVWVLDVGGTCVHVFHAGRPGHVVARESVLQALRILPDFALPLTEVFKRRGPRSLSGPTPGLAGPAGGALKYLLDELDSEPPQPDLWGDDDADLVREMYPE